MRAPIGNPFRIDTDEHSWIQELPEPATLDVMQRQFPTIVHPENPESFDLKTYPYGCLTRRGVEHLQRMGAQLRDSFPEILADLPSLPTGQLKVCSTNYQRTQASAQAFLHGLGAPPGTPIQVREFTDCAMSFYHGKRELSAQLSRRIRALEPSLELDRAVAHTEEPLLACFPDMDTGADMNWIRVADHLNCQVAHDQELHPQVQPHADLLRGNSVQRFVTHYKDREFLAHFAGPLLLDVLLEIRAAAAARLAACSSVSDSDSGVDMRPHVTVFSGHDVNILGMLFALNAVIDDAHWPSYGATLSFEVVEVLPEGEKGSAPTDMDELLSRLRVHFYYHSGEDAQALAPLALHTDRSRFDKRTGGFTTADEVAEVLSRQEHGHEQGLEPRTAVVTSLSYEAFLRLQEEVAGGHTAQEEGSVSVTHVSGAEGGSGGAAPVKGLSGFI
eukprot:CAMPEP_0114428966 /NCGR_PEP_ID=MMETSP0103-20121206/9222_1 /TAXON_ID=37642 ORGANISM="Paraphysomonas imperforata, Strain PA2" /NCGR_SAMPLE_ID=MMETSP0103 /ASSEMBLY_ACC=CAM_ASM_000201 /LENGTH=444 /DNA_ID=CAMNT_0001598247 /DNA_START=95 /DNA_END=1429 /DNA_ORIENTATION=+